MKSETITLSNIEKEILYVAIEKLEKEINRLSKKVGEIKVGVLGNDLATLRVKCGELKSKLL